MSSANDHVTALKLRRQNNLITVVKIIGGKKMAKKKLEINQKTAERILELRLERRWTQKELGKRIEKSEQMIRRYELGQTGVPEEELNRLEKVFKVIRPYLTGVTNKRTWREYAAESDSTEEAASDGYWVELEQKTRTLAEFLSTFCGFQYIIDRDAEAYISFKDLGDGDYDTPYRDVGGAHRLSRSGAVLGVVDPNKDFFFSDEELEGLINNIRLLVEFECFKKKLREVD